MHSACFGGVCPSSQEGIEPGTSYTALPPSYKPVLHHKRELNLGPLTLQALPPSYKPVLHHTTELNLSPVCFLCVLVSLCFTCVLMSHCLQCGLVSHHLTAAVSQVALVETGREAATRRLLL